MSNVNVGELDPSTHSLQFDANCGKIQYVDNPLGTINKKLLSRLEDLEKTSMQLFEMMILVRFSNFASVNRDSHGSLSSLKFMILRALF